MSMARIKLRTKAQAEASGCERRLTCNRDPLKFLDSAEAEVDNPEEILWRES